MQVENADVQRLAQRDWTPLCEQLFPDELF